MPSNICLRLTMLLVAHNIYDLRIKNSFCVHFPTSEPIRNSLNASYSSICVNCKKQLIGDNLNFSLNNNFHYQFSPNNSFLRCYVAIVEK